MSTNQPTPQDKSEIQQVGGDHYKSTYQHWDYVEDVKTSWSESNATKYIVRVFKKNGIQDLNKALTYLHKLKDNHILRKVYPPKSGPELDFKMNQSLYFFRSQDLRAPTAALLSRLNEVFQLICLWQDDEEIDNAIALVHVLKKEYEEFLRSYKQAIASGQPIFNEDGTLLFEDASNPTREYVNQDR